MQPPSDAAGKGKHIMTAGLRMKNLDVGALQAVFEVLQQHYPERLGELWFLNAPFIFWSLWRVVSPFIQANTKAKIKFLSGKDRERMLQEYIPPDVSCSDQPYLGSGLAVMTSI
jgi:hypothetical protein